MDDDGFGSGPVPIHLRLQVTADRILLDFSIGWGDCPAGCIYRRHWVFGVDNNCSVSLIAAFTD